jgi:glycosyltransferase involved in cell wall biosynthesis
MNDDFNSEDMTLCIAIPTFNRAIRLEKALHDLCNHILCARGKKRISVYVSNNGSTDATAAVLDEYIKIFRGCNVSYAFDNVPLNAGFDANVLNCYCNANGRYVWFLADDDNLEIGSIDSILEDIDRNDPAVIYYNFGQEPYTFQSPYIKESVFYARIDDASVGAISKIINYPKLTSVVLKRDLEKVGSKIKKTCSVEISRSYGYIHCALVIQAAFELGNVFLSNKFIAFSDPDYMDHIDFPPYVGGELVEIVDILLEANGKQFLKSALSIELADPLTTSMNALATFYRGRIVLTPELKAELEGTIRNSLKINKVFNVNFLMHFLRLIFALGYARVLSLYKGSPITKLKGRSDSYAP